MQLSPTTRAPYAIRATVELARHPFQLRTRRQLAAATKASPGTLAHVLVVFLGSLECATLADVTRPDAAG